MTILIKNKKCSGCGKSIPNCMAFGLDGKRETFCIGCLEKKGIDIELLEKQAFDVYDICSSMGHCKMSLAEFRIMINKLTSKNQHEKQKP